MEFFQIHIEAFLLVVFIMTLIWWRQLYTQNAGIVDGWWAMNFGIIGIFYFLVGRYQDYLSITVLILLILWSFRLGIHLLVRNTSHSEEDIRYSLLRKEYGDRATFKMWRFFVYQAFSNVLLAFPFAMMFWNDRISIFWLGPGALIWLVAFLGESIADNQLRKFKSDPKNDGKVCQQGLWYYSRHPNYFFEWLIWVSYFLMALTVSWGWLSILCPLLMYFLLNKVTGIPMLEELSIKSKGAAYLEYQRTTSPFFPWFKKKND